MLLHLYLSNWNSLTLWEISSLLQVRSESDKEPPPKKKKRISLKPNFTVPEECDRKVLTLPGQRGLLGGSCWQTPLSPGARQIHWNQSHGSHGPSLWSPANTEECHGYTQVDSSATNSFYSRLFHNTWNTYFWAPVHHVPFIYFISTVWPQHGFTA